MSQSLLLKKIANSKVNRLNKSSIPAGSNQKRKLERPTSDNFIPSVFVFFISFLERALKIIKKNPEENTQRKPPMIRKNKVNRNKLSDKAVREKSFWMIVSNILTNKLVRLMIQELFFKSHKEVPFLTIKIKIDLMYKNIV